MSAFILNKKKKSFTLIEMAIVLFIIALLMLLFLPNIGAQKTKATEKQALAMVKVVQTQVDLYSMDNDADSVSFGELQSAGYLTGEQVEKAQKIGISISGTNVSK
ncbi:MAG: prepilin-type N-terminal cleavage/methylation domain-containing protein [Lactobacillaceae bacterium]|jgi:competence protein ComGC|nr:prepilin-type N-terminal cleavage/methylation domain-containing protein [Lactobacillaceae bacterium]